MMVSRNGHRSREFQPVVSLAKKANFAVFRRWRRLGLIRYRQRYIEMDMSYRMAIELPIAARAPPDIDRWGAGATQQTSV